MFHPGIFHHGDTEITEFFSVFSVFSVSLWCFLLQRVVVEFGGEEALAGQGDGDAGGVDSDPAAAPLLGDVGRRAAPAGGVEDEVAGVGGHEHTTFNNCRSSLHHINFALAKSTGYGIDPSIGKNFQAKIVIVRFET